MEPHAIVQKIVTDLFTANKITLLEWPGNSPGRNPIKNLWAVLKDKVTNKHLSNISTLIEATKLVWIRKIPEGVCKNLNESMSRRMKAVIKAKGGFTKY